MSWHGADYSAFAQRVLAALAAHQTITGTLAGFLIGVIVGAIIF